MSRYLKLGILVAGATVLAILIVSQLQIYRAAVRVLDTAIETRQSELNIVDRFGPRIDEVREETRKTSLRLEQLNRMFPAELELDQFIIDVTEWMQDSGIEPLSVTHTQTAGDFHVEASVLMEFAQDPESVGILLSRPTPWDRLVVLDLTPTDGGGTTLELRLFAIDDLPPETPRLPCIVPTVRVWLWPLSGIVRARQELLARLCARVEEDRETLEASEKLTDLKRKVEYIQHVSAAVVEP